MPTHQEQAQGLRHDEEFHALRSLTQGIEVDVVSNEGDMTPFPREDTVMAIYDGCPTPRMCRVSNPNLGTPARCGWG
jgi:hypothetical protein